MDERLSEQAAHHGQLLPWPISGTPMPMLVLAAGSAIVHVSDPVRACTRSARCRRAPASSSERLADIVTPNRFAS